MEFVRQLFRSPEYYECKSDQELTNLQAHATERMDTAKRTNKAFQAKKKTLKANEQIITDNLEYWEEDAQSKTNVAKVWGKTGKKMGKLAPKFAGALAGGVQADQQARTRVQELTTKYGNVARGGNVSAQMPGLPGGF